LSTAEAKPLSFHEIVSPPEALIEEARNGRMVILVDDEGREDECDLVVPAQMATPQAINFMARYGRGLICLALTRERVEQLGLPLMSRQNGTRHQTAFTVSIEARDGVTTGISAPDRARTIAIAIDPSKGPQDIVTPGHVFPLVARDGGVLVRAGHTEAAVDIARLAGLNPSGVICEIMNDDGTMARRGDLIRFAQFHNLKVGTIAVNKVAYAEHIALVKGEIGGEEPVLVRMHALNVLDDVLGDRASGKGGELQAAMRMIAEAGKGIVVLIREPLPTSLSDRVRRKLERSKGGSTLRDYGIGAQILSDLGVQKMILLSNTRRTIVGLEGHGLSIVGQQPIAVPDGSD
jgi:3,4-dihydroxy 2-butanone 4-phosphate synthase/GTP cyclohydrolase II